MSKALRALATASLLGLLVSACTAVEGDVQERGRDLCFDGVDNDHDGLMDCDDPYCKIYCEEICTDYVDNDGDGFNGCDDPKCAGKKCFTPIEVCDLAGDEDNNGSEGCADPACAKTSKCLAKIPEDCSNRFDDNGNLLVDCNDPQCLEDAACPYEHCANGKDDDGNGDVDCDDPACTASCIHPEKCTGGLDEDEDGTIDCADSNCRNDVACIDGCRVQRKYDLNSSKTIYDDSCSAEEICVCSGAPACPTMDPDVWDYLGDFVGVSELCGLPPTCQEGGACRAVVGHYTLRLLSAGAVFDDPLNEPELYVVVNDVKLTDVQETYDIDCDDCYIELDSDVTGGINVKLMDQDILPTPLGDVDHSDTLAECNFGLDARTLKSRALECRGSGGHLEFTLEPHPG